VGIPSVAAIGRRLLDNLVRPCSITPVVAEPKRTVFLSAAEASADAHCARLIPQLRAAIPQVRCIGLGGDAMARAGCHLLENLSDRSAMLAHALAQVVFYFRLLRRLKRFLREEHPDLVIVADSPAWNFHVAQAARRLGIPVLYYIAPQLWAWGDWRVKKLRRCADRLACILPFEEEWFTQRGIPATYVGHPLFDTEQRIEPVNPLGPVSDSFPTVALLPGSRNHEIGHLWPVLQRLAHAVRDEYPRARFLTAAHSDAVAARLRVQADPTLPIDIRCTSIEACTRHADLALVASGTATLEVAAQNCPMIILYHVPAWQWHLVGRWLVKTKFLSLVNILAGRELVPEFMPLPRRLDPVIDVALALLADDKRRQALRLALRQLVEPLTQPGTARRVAQIAQEMLPLY